MIRSKTALQIATIAGALLALAVIWAWFDLRAATSDLNGARNTLVAIAAKPTGLETASGRLEVHNAIAATRRRVGRAGNRLRRSPPLQLSRLIPGVGRQRDGLLDLVNDATAAVDVGDRLVSAVDGLSATPVANGTVPLAQLAQLQAEVARGADQLAPLARGSKGLWGWLGSTRSDFDEVARSTAARFHEAAEAIGVARSFMGESGPRRYFIAAQNNAEMRDQGMVLSYAVISFDNGKLTFERSGSISEDFREPIVSSVPMTPGIAELWSYLVPQAQWRSVNVTADFAWSGRVMADLYGKISGQSVDGVIAIDVPGLAHILRVVGPVAVPGIAEPVTATNAPALLLQQLYNAVPVTDQSTRHESLAEVSGAIVTKIRTGEHDAGALGQRLALAAAEGHLRAYSADAREEAVFERVGLGGSPAARNPDRTIHVAVQNAIANKVDFYIRPEVSVNISITKLGTAVVRTTVRAKNPLPLNVKPSYAMGPTPGVTWAKPGQFAAWVDFWSPAGSQQTDGVKEAGLVVTQKDLNALPGTSDSVEFEAVMPLALRNGTLELRFVPQPRVVPLTLTVTLEAPGWHIQGVTQFSTAWAKTFTARWKIAR